MGTSLGLAIDYLMTGSSTLTSSQTLQQALTAVDANALLADTLPVANQPSLVVVGRPDFDNSEAAALTAQYQSMGKQKLTEDYLLNGYIECYKDGPAVKPVRDAALALYDAVTHWVWLDPTFNGALQDGRVGFVSTGSLQITGGTAESPGDTRMAYFPFSLHIQNHYTP